MKNVSLKQFSRIFRDRFEPESLKHVADFYWRMIVISFILLCLLDLAFGAYEYYSVAARTAQMENQSEPNLPYTEEQLQSVISALENRNVSYQVVAAEGESATTTPN